MRLWNVRDVDMQSQPAINEVVFSGSLEECQGYVASERAKYRRVDPMQSTPIWEIEPASQDWSERMRSYIDAFGMRTMRTATEASLTALGIAGEIVPGCLRASVELRRSFEAQRRYEAAIVEPY